jgi:hypothetical protein
MKVHAGFVYLVLSSALAGTPAGASTVADRAAKHLEWPRATVEVARPTPVSLVIDEPFAKRHRYPVNDEKGLLLTCIAPEIENDSETDVFNNCTLAPGRTLDDVMHSFVRGIHEEQRQRMKEHAESDADAETTARKNASQ